MHALSVCASESAVKERIGLLNVVVGGGALSLSICVPLLIIHSFLEIIPLLLSCRRISLDAEK